MMWTLAECSKENAMSVGGSEPYGGQLHSQNKRMAQLTTRFSYLAPFSPFQGLLSLLERFPRQWERAISTREALLLPQVQARSQMR